MSPNGYFLFTELKREAPSLCCFFFLIEFLLDFPFLLEHPRISSDDLKQRQKEKLWEEAFFPAALFLPRAAGCAATWICVSRLPFSAELFHRSPECCTGESFQWNEEPAAAMLPGMEQAKELQSAGDPSHKASTTLTFPSLKKKKAQENSKIFLRVFFL